MPEVRGIQKERRVGQTDQISNAILPMSLFANEQQAQRKFLSAMQGLAGVAGKEGLRLAAMEADTQFAELQGFANEERRKMDQHVRTSNVYDDVPATGEQQAQPGYHTVWNNTGSKAISEKISGLTNNAAKRAAELWWTKTSPILEGEIDGWVDDGRTDFVSAQSMKNIGQIIGGDYTLQTQAAEVANAVSTEKGEPADQPTTQDETKLSIIERIVDKNVASNVWSEKQGAKIISDATKLIEQNKQDGLKAGMEAETFAIAASEGFEEAEAHLRDADTTLRLIEAGVPRSDIRSLLNDISERLKTQKVQFDEKLDAQRETDRGATYDVINSGVVTNEDGTTSTDIRGFIENTSLDEDEQETMWQRSIKETERKLKGLDIITVPQTRSQFYREIPLMLSGAVSRDQLLDQVNEARFGRLDDNGKFIEPTLGESDYKSLVTSINNQYEEGYGRMMGQVNSYAEGILLKTDSLGFVENAPVRHKSMGDFQEAWFKWVAGKGDQLKISEIYSEGRKLAATFQISDDEAARRETVFLETLKKQESGGGANPFGDAITKAGKKKKLTPKIARRYLDITDNDIEEAKRLAAEDGYRE